MTQAIQIYSLQHDYDLDPNDVHLDAAVSNILINYRPSGFIADQIMPIVPVAKQSDNFYILDQGDRFRREEDKRAPGTEPNLVTFNVSSDGYRCKNYALGTYLVREEVANADAALDVRNTRSELVMDMLLANYEYRVATLCGTANVGSSTITASAWGDGPGNADPYKDCQTDINKVWDSTGYRPNIAVFGQGAWRLFRDSANVRALLYPHGGGIPTLAQAKMLLDVDKILVGGAYYNSAAQGVSMSLTSHWGYKVFYAYIPPAPAMDRPTWGYSFRWNVDGVPAMQVRTFPWDDKLGRQDIHVGYYQDEKVIDTKLGFVRCNVQTSA